MRNSLDGSAISPLDRVLRVRQLAELLRVRVAWVYDHAESGYLPCAKIGRTLRFRERDVHDWLRARGVANAAFLPVGSGPLMTVKDVESHLQVSRSWVYEARRSKRLPHFKLDGHLRFSRGSIDAWFDEMYGPGLDQQLPLSADVSTSS